MHSYALCEQFHRSYLDLKRLVHNVSVHERSLLSRLCARKPLLVPCFKPKQVVLTYFNQNHDLFLKLTK